MLKATQRILCPVDIYDFQPEAAEYALTLANALDAEITVLYVLEPLPPRYIVDGVSIPAIAEEEAAKRKAEIKMSKVLREFFTPRAGKGEVVPGLAADEIVRVAGECSADMIVMASHGRSVLGRAIHGSVTNKVLGSTKIPVLVIQPDKEQ